MLGDQVGVGERREQPEGAGPGIIEAGGDGRPQVHAASIWASGLTSSAGQRRRATKRSAYSRTASPRALPSRAGATAAKQRVALVARAGWPRPTRAASTHRPSVPAVAVAAARDAAGSS